MNFFRFERKLLIFLCFQSEINFSSFLWVFKKSDFLKNCLFDLQKVEFYFIRDNPKSELLKSIWRPILLVFNFCANKKKIIFLFSFKAIIQKKNKFSSNLESTIAAEKKSLIWHRKKTLSEFNALDLTSLNKTTTIEKKNKLCNLMCMLFDCDWQVLVER